MSLLWTVVRDLVISGLYQIIFTIHITFAFSLFFWAFFAIINTVLVVFILLSTYNFDVLLITSAKARI